MRTISYKLDDLKKAIIRIGYVGENQHTQVRIDCSDLFKEYPDAAVSAAIVSPAGQSYPKVVTVDGSTVVWDVTDSDLAADGDGEIQLTFTEGGVVAKTAVARFNVYRSITAEGPAPDPVDDWLQEASEALEDIEAAEVNQPIIGQDGYWHTWDQEAGEYQKTDTKAEGQDGEDGHTPVLSSSKSGKTTTIYADGDQLAQIQDGQDANIDDTSTAADKVWSAAKSNTLLSDIQGMDDTVSEISEPYGSEPSINLFNPAWMTNAGWTYNEETGEYVGTPKQLTTYYANSAGFPIDFEPNTQYCIYFLAHVDPQGTIVDSNGLSCTVTMTDGNTHVVKVKNNQLTDVSVKVSTYANMSARSASKIRMSYDGYGDNVWHIKNLMLVKDYVYTAELPEYVPYGNVATTRTAKDEVARNTLIQRSDNIDRDVLIYRDKIPAYFLAYPANPASFSDDNHVDYKISLIPEGKRLLFFTDTHWESNAKHSIPIMQYVRGRKGIKTVLYGGDFIDRRNDKYLAKQTLTDFTSQCLAAFSDGMLTAIGNHDTNLANYSGDSKDDLYLPFTLLHKAFFDDIKDKVYTQAQYDYEKITALTNDSEDLAELLAYFSTIYYYDDEKEHIRYIVVNTGNNQSGAVYNIINLSYNQEMRIQWDFVDYALQTVPSGWDVILFGHDFAPIDTSTGVFSWHDEARVMFDMLGRRKTHRDGSISIPSKEILRTWYGGETYEYDYTNLPDIGKCIVFFGHTHTDKILNTYYNESGYIRLNQTYDGTVLNQDETGKIPLICLTTDAYAQSRTVEQYGVPMEQGTITEQAFDAITIMDGSMKLIRFGAGNDRTVLF